jgi:hypothetical protein
MIVKRLERPVIFIRQSIPLKPYQRKEPDNFTPASSNIQNYPSSVDARIHLALRLGLP